MKLCIITTSDNLYQKISAFYALSNWETSRYTGNIPDSGILILVTPVLIDGNHYDLDRIWKAYANKSDSNLLILSASYLQSFHTDIDLLNLPRHLNESLKSMAYTQSEPNQKYCKDISSKLNILLDGHGEESLLKRVTQLKSGLDVVKFLQLDGFTLEEAFGQIWGDEIKTIVEELPERWKEMEVFAVFTPLFLKTEQEVDFNIQESRELDMTLEKLEVMSLYLRSLKNTISH